MNYAAEVPPRDEVVRAHGVTVCIDPKALFNVVGTVMDWKEDDLSAEFTFENPNSKGECGCGEVSESREGESEREGEKELEAVCLV